MSTGLPRIFSVPYPSMIRRRSPTILKGNLADAVVHIDAHGIFTKFPISRVIHELNSYQALYTIALYVLSRPSNPLNSRFPLTRRFRRTNVNAWDTFAVAHIGISGTAGARAAGICNVHPSHTA